MQILRGTVATLAAFAVMSGLAVAALALSGVPVTWPFVATVLAAALGGPATLTGSLGEGAMGAVLNGTADVAPLGISATGALVFCGVMMRARPAAIAMRAVGASGAMAAVLVAVVAAADAVVGVTVPAGARQGMREAQLVIRPDTSATVLGGLLAVVVLSGCCALLAALPWRRVAATVALAGLTVPVVGGLALAPYSARRRSSAPLQRVDVE